MILWLINRVCNQEILGQPLKLLISNSACHAVRELAIVPILHIRHITPVYWIIPMIGCVAAMQTFTYGIRVKFRTASYFPFSVLPVLVKVFVCVLKQQVGKIVRN